MRLVAAACASTSRRRARTSGPASTRSASRSRLYDDARGPRARRAPTSSSRSRARAPARCPTGEAHLVVQSAAAARSTGSAPHQSGLHLSVPQRRSRTAGARLVGGRGGRGRRRRARAAGRPRRARRRRRPARSRPTFEGHPDNAAARHPRRRDRRLVRARRGAARRSCSTHDPTGTPSCWCPATRLATATARGLLPATVPHADAAFTAGRAALLVEALGQPPRPAARRHRGPPAPALPRAGDAGTRALHRRAAGRGCGRRRLRRRADRPGARAPATGDADADADGRRPGRRRLGAGTAGACARAGIDRTGAVVRAQ